jgi:hypothetical protein
MPAKKNVLKGLKGIFWTGDESGEEAPEGNPPEKAIPKSSATAPSVLSTTSSDTEVVIDSGKEDSGIKATLMDALSKASSKGTYDYLKFAQSVTEQAKIIPAEETRFIATFTIAKSLGLTQASLISDAQRYLDVLKQEESKFQSSTEGLNAREVSSKETTLSSIDKQMGEKADQIKSLTDEINTLQKQRNELTDDITQSKIKIEKFKNNYAATLKTVVDRITGDIEKIKKYIPA